MCPAFCLVLPFVLSFVLSLSCLAFCLVFCLVLSFLCLVMFLSSLVVSLSCLVSGLFFLPVSCLLVTLSCRVFRSCLTGSLYVFHWDGAKKRGADNVFVFFFVSVCEVKRLPQRRVRNVFSNTFVTHCTIWLVCFQKTQMLKHYKRKFLSQTDPHGPQTRQTVSWQTDNIKKSLLIFGCVAIHGVHCIFKVQNLSKLVIQNPYWYPQVQG